MRKQAKYNKAEPINTKAMVPNLPQTCCLMANQSNEILAQARKPVSNKLAKRTLALNTGQPGKGL
jgi:hypothetical protein